MQQKKGLRGKGHVQEHHSGSLAFLGIDLASFQSQAHNINCPLWNFTLPIGLSIIDYSLYIIDQSG